MRLVAGNRAAESPTFTRAQPNTSDAEAPGHKSVVRHCEAAASTGRLVLWRANKLESRRVPRPPQDWSLPQYTQLNTPATPHHYAKHRSCSIPRRGEEREREGGLFVTIVSEHHSNPLTKDARRGAEGEDGPLR